MLLLLRVVLWLVISLVVTLRFITKVIALLVRRLEIRVYVDAYVHIARWLLGWHIASSVVHASMIITCHILVASDSSHIRTFHITHATLTASHRLTRLVLLLFVFGLLIVRIFGVTEVFVRELVFAGLLWALTVTTFIVLVLVGA